PGRCGRHRDHQATLVLPLALSLGGLDRPAGPLHHPSDPDRGPGRIALRRPLLGARSAQAKAVDRVCHPHLPRLARPDQLRPRHRPRPPRHELIMPRRLALVIGLLALAVTVGAPEAMAHGGDEEAMEELKMQPAATLAQQALVELKINGDVKDAAVRLDAA